MNHEPTTAALKIYREALLDPTAREFREQFSRTCVEYLDSIASWLGVDSFLGAGDIVDTSTPKASLRSPDRIVAFRATAAVIEMASQLASQTIQSLDQGRRFAAAALIRQLIETEYLLTVFASDFSEGARWVRSSPDDIRRSFSPQSMRSVGGFSNEEYWRHCDMGGHPTPTGRFLLAFDLGRSRADAEFSTASVWGDLAQHLRRLWVRVDLLLRAQHARYATVRRNDYDRVRRVEEQWLEVDPLADPVDWQLLNDIAATDENDD